MGGRPKGLKDLRFLVPDLDRYEDILKEPVWIHGPCDTRSMV